MGLIICFIRLINTALRSGNHCQLRRPDFFKKKKTVIFSCSPEWLYFDYSFYTWPAEYTIYILGWQSILHQESGVEVATQGSFSCIYLIGVLPQKTTQEHFTYTMVASTMV